MKVVKNMFDPFELYITLQFELGEHYSVTSMRSAQTILFSAYPIIYDYEETFDAYLCPQ